MFYLSLKKNSNEWHYQHKSNTPPTNPFVMSYINNVGLSVSILYFIFYDEY